MPSCLVCCPKGGLNKNTIAFNHSYSIFFLILISGLQIIQNWKLLLWIHLLGQLRWWSKWWRVYWCHLGWWKLGWGWYRFAFSSHSSHCCAFPSSSSLPLLSFEETPCAQTFWYSVFIIIFVLVSNNENVYSIACHELEGDTIPSSSLASYDHGDMTSSTGHLSR